MEYRVDRKGDTTITLRQLTIKDIDNWDKMKAKDVYAKRKDANQSDTDVLDISIEITRETNGSLIGGPAIMIDDIENIDGDRR